MKGFYMVLAVLFAALLVLFCQVVKSVCHHMVKGEKHKDP